MPTEPAGKPNPVVRPALFWRVFFYFSWNFPRSKYQAVLYVIQPEFLAVYGIYLFNIKIKAPRNSPSDVLLRFQRPMFEDDRRLPKQVISGYLMFVHLLKESFGKAGILKRNYPLPEKICVYMG
jgi:hypothetical protein